MSKSNYIPLFCKSFLTKKQEIMIHKIILTTILSSAILSCNAQQRTNQDTKAGKYTYTKPAIPIIDSSDLGAMFYAKNPALDQRVNDIYNAMSNKERAAQMIMIASGETMGYKYDTYVVPNVKNGYAANVLFLKGTSTAFQRQAKAIDEMIGGTLKPLYACDCEPSLLHYKITDKPKMNATSKLLTAEDIKNSVDSINKVMDEIGIQINFAPVTDIAKNKSIINNRSFGSNADSIALLNDYFIQYTQKDKKAATIKHFPGHGAVVGDTHKQSVYINGAMTELNTFQQVIDKSNPIFVMVGHISIKNNPDGYNTENARPASTSRNLVTNLLKKDMKFKGLVTTDAMNMAASASMPNADFEAVKAGVDLILMPLNPKDLHAKIQKEFDHQTALSKELEQSVKKIIRLKLLTAQ